MDKLCVEDVKAERERLTQEMGELSRRCSHKHRDGSDATVGVPVSGERFCRTCGGQFD